MAESSGEKTEMPTQKKLRDARQKGQVCTSKDIVSTAILVGLFVLLGWMGIALVDDASMLLGYIGNRMGGDPFAATGQAMGMTAFVICKHSFIFVLVAAVIGIAANTAQIGFLFTFEPIIPKLEKLNPVEGAKKIFSMKNLFEFLKNIVKVCFLSYLLYKIIWASVPELLTMCYGTIDDIFPCLKLMLKRLAVYTAFGYIVIAVVDRLFQGRNFTKEMMMTKDEVKREYKEMEGSAEIQAGAEAVPRRDPERARSAAGRLEGKRRRHQPDASRRGHTIQLGGGSAPAHLRTWFRANSEDHPRGSACPRNSDHGGSPPCPRTLCRRQDRGIRPRLAYRGSPQVGQAASGRQKGRGRARQRDAGRTASSGGRGGYGRNDIVGEVV